MLKITRLSDKACFLTGSTENVVDVKFDDKTFSGAISWSALLEIITRRANEAKAEESKAKPKTGQASFTTTSEGSHRG